MKKLWILMAAMACLLVISCKKDNDYASSILGSWEGYSRSSTFLKNGEAVTAQTFIKDMILIGEWESPEDDEEMADLIDYAKTVIHDEYLLKGDEDITLIFEKGGKLTSVFLDGDDRKVENLKYSISGSKLILSNTDPSDPQNSTMDIERLTDKELVLRYDGTQSALLNPSLRKIGYSIRFEIVFKKI